MHRVKLNASKNHDSNMLPDHVTHCLGRISELEKLLFAAGETVDETKVEKMPDYLKPEISLLNICRESIGGGEMDILFAPYL